MKLQVIPLSKLCPHPKNPRVHPDSAIEKLVRSIAEFGWTNPVLVDADWRILAGHARVKAAQKAGIAEVPVIQLPLSGARADAYLVADNRLQDETDWDLPMLGDLLQELQATGFAGAIGFDDHEWDELLAGRKDESPNAASMHLQAGKLKLIRPVLAMPEIATFERAIRRTGKRNRAEALIEICQHYLEAVGPRAEESGQFDPQAEGFAPADGVEGFS